MNSGKNTSKEHKEDCDCIECHDSLCDCSKCHDAAEQNAFDIMEAQATGN